MKTSDKFTITIAILALILSALSIYYQFFHSSNDLKASISMSQPGEDYVIYDVVFINSGTGYQSISSIWGWTSDRPFNENGSRHGVPVLTEPIVMKPGQMVHRRLKHDCSPKDPLREPVYAGLQFTTIDSRGQRHEALAPLLHFVPERLGYQYRYEIVGGIFCLSVKPDNENARIIKPLIMEVNSRHFGVGRPVIDDKRDQ